MKVEEDKLCLLWIAERPAFEDYRGNKSQTENNDGNDVVSAICNTAQPAIQSGAADEETDERRNCNGSKRCNELLYPVVVIPVVVVGCSQRKVSAIRPEYAGGQSHGEA